MGGQRALTHPTRHRLDQTDPPRTLATEGVKSRTSTTQGVGQRLAQGQFGGRRGSQSPCPVSRPLQFGHTRAGNAGRPWREGSVGCYGSLLCRLKAQPPNQCGLGRGISLASAAAMGMCVSVRDIRWRSAKGKTGAPIPSPSPQSLAK